MLGRAPALLNPPAPVAGAWLQARFSAADPSEEGLLGGYPIATGEPLRAGLHLTQDPIFESLMHHLGRLETELTERLRRPPVIRLAGTPGGRRL